MRAFYESYAEQDYVDMMHRFGFSTNEMCDDIFNYLENWIIPQFLYKGNGPTQNAAMGTLVTKALNDTYTPLLNGLPVQLATRNLAKTLKDTSTDCVFFLNAISPSTAATICAN